MQNLINIDTSQIRADVNQFKLRKSKSNLSFIEKRNKRLYAFLIALGYSNDIRLFGGEDNPGLIFKDKFLLSCYVKNFKLIFNNSSDYNSKELLNVALEDKIEIQDNEIDFIKAWMNLKIHKPVYRIQVKNTNLYLAGYNYRNVLNKNSKYPVYSEYNPRIFLKKDYALNTINELENNMLTFNLI